MDVQLLRETLSDILADLHQVSLVYLFGSQVEGHLGPLSDCDLGVLIDRSADGQKIRARLAPAIAHAVGTNRVDVVILNRVPVELAFAVIAQGQVLYQRDVATRVEFETQIMNRYGDRLPVLRAQRRDILRGDENAKRVHRYRAAFRRTERTLGQISAAERKEPRRV